MKTSLLDSRSAILLAAIDEAARTGKVSGFGAVDHPAEKRKTSIYSEHRWRYEIAAVFSAMLIVLVGIGALLFCG